MTHVHGHATCGFKRSQINLADKSTSMHIKVESSHLSASNPEPMQECNEHSTICSTCTHTWGWRWCDCCAIWRIWGSFVGHHDCVACSLNTYTPYIRCVLPSAVLMDSTCIVAAVLMDSTYGRYTRHLLLHMQHVILPLDLLACQAAGVCPTGLGPCPCRRIPTPYRPAGDHERPAGPSHQSPSPPCLPYSHAASWQHTNPSSP
jgi:hypothetical protein